MNIVSDELHALRGTRATRARPPEESPVIEGRPKFPPEFREQGMELEARFWKDATKLLKSKGTLARTDGPSLRLYAILSARDLRAIQDINARGQVYDEARFSKNGDPYTVRVVNPSVAIARDAERQLAALTKQLGLAPDARAKVQKVKQDPKKTEPKPGTAAFQFPEFFKETKKHGQPKRKRLAVQALPRNSSVAVSSATRDDAISSDDACGQSDARPSSDAGSD
jgi:P27 family predicted phage terminase small subunit